MQFDGITADRAKELIQQRMDLLILPTIYTGLDAMRSWPPKIVGFLKPRLVAGGRLLAKPAHRLLRQGKAVQESA